jgi:hypothetical protein
MRVLVCLALALVLAACGQASAPAPAGSTVPQPTLPEAETQARVTPGDLPGLAASVSDLPAGFSVSAEGAIAGQGTVLGGYRRAFDPGDATLGSSRLADLTNTVTLFATAAAAQVALGGILNALTGPQAQQSFAQLVLASTGIHATNLSGQTLVSGLGQASVAAKATFDTSAGSVEAIYVVALVGPVHCSVLLLGPKGDLQIGDAVKLMTVLLPRIEEAVTGKLAA